MNKVLVDKNVMCYIFTFLKPIQWIKLSCVNKQWYRWIIIYCDTVEFPLWYKFKVNINLKFWCFKELNNSYEILKYLYMLQKTSTSSMSTMINFAVNCLYPFTKLNVKIVQESVAEYELWYVRIDNKLMGILKKYHNMNDFFYCLIERTEFCIYKTDLCYIIAELLNVKTPTLFRTLMSEPIKINKKKVW